MNIEKRERQRIFRSDFIVAELPTATTVACNSTMRPINMCPEKFLPSCGTWRTIVTDRKVFAQVRIFSQYSSSVLFFHKACTRLLEAAAAAENLLLLRLLQRAKNALGQLFLSLSSSSSSSLPQATIRRERVSQLSLETHCCVREGKIRVQRQGFAFVKEEILSSKCPKWIGKKDFVCMIRGQWYLLLTFIFQSFFANTFIRILRE